MERKQFTFYRSYLDAIARLSKREQGAILLAICRYALNETEPAGLTPVAEVAFTLARPTLDAGRRKALAGEAGGRAEAKGKQTPGRQEAGGEQAPREGEREREEERESGTRELKAEKETEKEQEQEEETEQEPKSEWERQRRPGGGSAPGRAPFVPPGVEEVRDYCRRHGLSVDPRRFVDHYAPGGWMVGQSPMRDWRAVLHSWEERGGARTRREAGATSNPFLAMLGEEEDG